ncbi:hypothetical protein CVT26_015210 [Gymnopilus dilepis]|uniref:Uncharacterized protein n=1 Tax=Gymnopilus dilepis TaxID=231916 RepID=A0A409WS22_9AGAR|nr:hypothetical protein CVT26_015210 [Gymnopilus dilepis]
MQLVLNYLSKTTGWNFTVLGGGPEPARNGKFSLMSVHSGLTPGEDKQNFRESESADYDKVIVPFFERLLKETYSSDDRRACALDNNEDFLPLNEADLKLYGASLDLFEDDDTLEPFEPPHVDPEPEIQSSTRPHAEEPEPIFLNQNPRAPNSPKVQPGPAPTSSASEIAPNLPPELAISHHLFEDNSAPETAMASQVSPQTTGFATSFERWQEPPAPALSDAPTHGPTYRVISTSSKDAAVPTIFPMRTLRSIQDAELNSSAAESSNSLTCSSPEVDPCSSGPSSSEDPALKERLPDVGTILEFSTMKRPSPSSDYETRACKRMRIDPELVNYLSR